METARIALPLGAVGFAIVTLVVPLVRLRRRTGVWGITAVRRTDAAERAISALLAVLLAVALAWAFLFAACGRERIGAWLVPGWLAAAGGCLALGGFVLIVAAQARMGASWRIGIDDRPTPLVTGGLFAVVRNPIFSGMLVAFAGEVLIVPSPWLIAAWLAAALGIAVQTRREERHLIAMHGAAYLEYAARVGRFVPGIGRLRRRP